MIATTVDCARCGSVAERRGQKCSHCEYRPPRSTETGPLDLVVGFLVSAAVVGTLVITPLVLFDLARTRSDDASGSTPRPPRAAPSGRVRAGPGTEPVAAPLPDTDS
jgi:hypothetical protein